jgi:hypothetical protein
VRSLLLFLRRYDLPADDDIWPLSFDHLAWWLAYLTDHTQLAARSIETYFSAVCTEHQMRDCKSPRDVFPQLALLLKGMQRTRAAAAASSQQPATRTRLAITVPLLKQMISTHLNHGDRLHTMLIAAMTTATAGLFRLSEIVAKRVTGDAEHRTPRVRDVRFFSSEGAFVPAPSPEQCAEQVPDYFEIFLPMSKTDQLRHGAKIIISSPLAVQSMWQYFIMRRHCPAPAQHLFTLPNGTPLTVSQLIAHTRAALASVGQNAAHYSGHSFRRGGATTLARAGQMQRLKAAGRWKSDCFKLYIESEMNIALLIAAGKTM